MQGQLVMWNAARGFGFVQAYGTTEISDRFFVHISNFQEQDKKNVKLGVQITFTVGDPVTLGKKPQATNAKVVETVSTLVAPTSGVAALAPQNGGAA